MKSQSVASAAFHDRPVGIEPVEQQHNGQAGKCLLDARGEAVKGLGLAVLLALPVLACLVLEKLAHQRDDHAVSEAEAGLQYIDVVLVALLLVAVGIDLGSGSALQQVLVPQGGEGDLLGAVDADGVAVVDQVAGELLVADQMIDQRDMRLLDCSHIDAA